MFPTLARPVLAAPILALAAASAPAAPTALIAEITQQASTASYPDASFLFGIGAYTNAAGGADASPLYHFWSQADVGTVVHVAGAQLDAWRAIYAQPSAMLQLDAIYGGTLLFPDQFFSGENLPPGVTVASYLPQRGPALTGYVLADVSQTLTQFDDLGDGGNNGPTPDHGWQVTHVIRFWVFVPEPATALLLLPAVTIFLVRRHG